MVSLCKLKMLYMFKTFVSLLSGHALYLQTEHPRTCLDLRRKK